MFVFVIVRLVTTAVLNKQMIISKRNEKTGDGDYIPGSYSCFIHKAAVLNKQTFISKQNKKMEGELHTE